MTSNDEQLHWLVRPATIRKLWIGFGVVLALVVLAQSVIYIKGYFGVDGWFGFGAIYGFGCCLLMVLVWMSAILTSTMEPLVIEGSKLRTCTPLSNTRIIITSP